MSASRPSLGSSLLAGFNTVMRAILVPNQIAPRVAAECFRWIFVKLIKILDNNYSRIKSDSLR